MSDLISREAVLNLFATHDGNYLYEAIRDMPAVEPEKLTDNEQRIFLSAMGREEEVCKEVDDAWRDCREPYEDSLVHVCKEIKRKVKGALWT